MGKEWRVRWLARDGHCIEQWKIGGTGFDVNATGALVFRNAGAVVKMFAPGAWSTVEPVE